MVIGAGLRRRVDTTRVARKLADAVGALARNAAASERHDRAAVIKHGAVSSWQFVDRNGEAIGAGLGVLSLDILDVYLNVVDGGAAY